jgi:hypothetical protein
MPLSDTIKTLIRNAWDDGYHCLLATHGREGPATLVVQCSNGFDTSFSPYRSSRLSR